MGEVKEKPALSQLWDLGNRRQNQECAGGLPCYFLCAFGRRLSQRDPERCHIQVNLTTCHNQEERGFDMYFHSWFYFLCGTNVELKDSWPPMWSGILGKSAYSVEVRGAPDEGRKQRLRGHCQWELKKGRISKGGGCECFFGALI